MRLRTRRPAREEEKGAGGSGAGALMTGDGERRRVVEESRQGGEVRQAQRRGDARGWCM
jgi:hypothetical protein